MSGEYRRGAGAGDGRARDRRAAAESAIEQALAVLEHGEAPSVDPAPYSPARFA